MNKCKDCAKWECGATLTYPGWPARARCLRFGNQEMTWADAQFPAFEARKDWAWDAFERALPSMRAECYRDAFDIIRAAAAKHYEGGKV